MTYASYERTVTVQLFAYTATVETSAGQTTASLTVRQDPEWGSRRREVQCPNCTCWYTLYYNSNVQAYEPVHCTGCCIGLYDIQPAPVVATPEPVAEKAAEPVASGEDDLLNLDFALDPNKETLTAMEYAMATPEQIAAWRAARKTVEQDALIAELAFEADAVIDRERYFAARSGKYVLLHMRESGLAVNCSCPDRVKKGRFQGRCCKHMTAHNAMITPAKKQQEAA